jgi:hypothetical protein
VVAEVWRERVVHWHGQVLPANTETPLAIEVLEDPDAVGAWVGEQLHRYTHRRGRNGQQVALTLGRDLAQLRARAMAAAGWGGSWPGLLLHTNQGLLRIQAVVVFHAANCQHPVDPAVRPAAPRSLKPPTQGPTTGDLVLEPVHEGAPREPSARASRAMTAPALVRFPH